MSIVQKPAPPSQQPATFAFTPENKAAADRIVARYPDGRQASAMMPLLELAQRQNDNWLPRAAVDHVAALLQVPRIRAYEVATFYSMYNLAPVGRHVVRVCTTTPCWLRGSDDIVGACEKSLGVGLGETTADGKFSLREVECLGACVNAPVAWIDDHYFEDLSPERMAKLLEALARGERLAPGPQGGRRSSEPASGLTTLGHGTRK
jgi:NADH-quinone oxidoreductase subunit E